MNRAFALRISSVYIFLVASSNFPMLFFTRPFVFLKELPEIIFWIILEIIADMKPLTRYKSGKELSELSMSFVVQLSIIFLMDTAKAVWIVIIATLVVEYISKKPLSKVLFNSGQYGLSLLVSSYLFNILKMSSYNVNLDIIMDLPAILAAICSYYILNTFFVSAVVSLTTGIKFIEVFLCDFKALTSYFYTLALISMAASLIYDSKRPYIIFIMIPPVIMADQAVRRYYSLHQETQKTLNVLADAIDERDKYTSAHSIRVAAYAKNIASYLDLHMYDINEIEMAGRVHDLGKVSIPDEILLKHGRLSDEEYKQIKKHPGTAYRLLKNLKPYKNGAAYVLYHHEHFDGSGYPTGLSGSHIPLGARILAVADSYDAMTTDRPYRRALPQSVAVDELRKRAGTQFDPQVIDAFINVLKNDYGYKEM